MTKRNDIYRCPVCGNVVEVLHEGAILSCCGRPMLKMEPNMEETSEEKHMPVVSIDGHGMNIKIGAAEHPMSDEHHIEWVEVISGDRQTTHHLKPGDKPQTSIPFPYDRCDGKNSASACGPLIVRAYCNIHGLWVKEV